SSSKEGAGVGLLRRLNLRRERRPAVAGGGAEVAVAEETGRGERVGDEADRYDDQTEGDVQPADTWAEQAVGDGREAGIGHHVPVEIDVDVGRDHRPGEGGGQVDRRGKADGAALVRRFRLEPGQ